MNTMTLEDLGYDDFFESDRAGRGSEGVRVARVIAQARGGYRVKDAEGEYVAKVTGKRMHVRNSHSRLLHVRIRRGNRSKVTV
jgi:hypothetical protein